MDKNQKFLKKLSSTEQVIPEEILIKLIHNDLSGLDIKKLKGYQNIFRVRIRSIRIIYRATMDDIFVLEISRRNDTTYRNY